VKMEGGEECGKGMRAPLLRKEKGGGRACNSLTYLDNWKSY